ncbi:alpha/beta hydrolase family protein [Allokutzneria albata]|uniref:Alpha/beta hydrolase family protein n=1 Tax=Allokutzneria albata TaxID=211114 RepID=A0A1G9UKQ8_ALLAB|nr:lipase [Allokutzneria albata]SDM60476.1 Alpha/beta hydrolase family protein [Allokutzneria albata]
MVPFGLLAAAGAALALVAAPAPVASAAPQAKATFHLPAPTGRHDVGATELHLVDASRKDPWKPERARELMVSVRYPAREAGRFPRAPWISSGLAAVQDGFGAGLGIPKDSVDWTGVLAHARSGAPAEHGRHPVVLYTPGLGFPRSAQTAIVEDLASRGYVVVGIDHTFETNVEFPGGRVEVPAHLEIEPVTMKKILDVRVADTRFVLDSLVRLAAGANPDAESRPLPRGLGGALDLGRIGVFGHSYGGFTGGETMVHDRRVDAGVNLDGSMAYGFGELMGQPYLPGEVTKLGLDRPFLLMGSEAIDPATGKLVRHTHLNDHDRSWPQFWANQRGWKRDLLLGRSGHLAYTDYQVVLRRLAQQLNLPAQRVEQLVGTIDAGRSIAAQRTYVAGFFDLHLRQRDTGLFTGPSPLHPDITFITD